MGGPAKKYGTAEDVGDLPVCRFDQGIVSCWRPTWAERLSILFFGRAWLHVIATPRTHPPVALIARRTYLNEVGQ